MLFSYIVVLTCVWWVVFFMVLPYGNQIDIKPEKGHADSAPTNPRIGIKIAITSVISIILTVIIVYLLEHHHIARFVDKYISWLSGV